MTDLMTVLITSAKQDDSGVVGQEIVPLRQESCCVPFSLKYEPSDCGEVQALGQPGADPHFPASTAQALFQPCFGRRLAAVLSRPVPEPSAVRGGAPSFVEAIRLPNHSPALLSAPFPEVPAIRAIYEVWPPLPSCDVVAPAVALPVALSQRLSRLYRQSVSGVTVRRSGRRKLSTPREWDRRPCFPDRK